MKPLPRKFALPALAGVLLLGVFFRFYEIKTVPPGLYPDEAANGNNAVEALRTDSPTGGFKLFYPENNGREGLFINIQALAVKAFGAHPWSLRIVSAIIGSLTILGAYFAARELYNQRVGLLAAFFLASSFWHINFSRIGFRAIMVPFFAVFGIFWLVRAIRSGKITSALLGGLAIGLGFHTYIAFRFMPFVIAIPIGFALWNWKKSGASTAAPIRKFHANGANVKPPCAPCMTALFLLAAFVAALPIGLYFLQHPADFIGRSGQVSIFASSSPLVEFVKSNLLTLGMLNIRGDCNSRHNLSCQPELFWAVGAFFIFGLWQIIRLLFKKPFRECGREILVLGWFFLMTLPATLTREGLPHALRSIGMIPPVMIIAAVGAYAIWRRLSASLDAALTRNSLRPYWPRLARIKKEIMIAAILLLASIPVQAFQDYFFKFAARPVTIDAFASDIWRAGELLDNMSADVPKYVIVNLRGEEIRGAPAPAQTVMFATDTFDEYRRREKNIEYVTSLEAIPDGLPAAIIVPLNAHDRDLISAIRSRFPNLKAGINEGVIIFSGTPLRARNENPESKN